MIEVALLLGLGAVGYLLAVEQPKKTEEQPPSSEGAIENYRNLPAGTMDDGMEPNMTNK